MNGGRSGELRGACKRSSTPGHRRHSATIQPYQNAAETTRSGASPVSFFCIYSFPPSPAVVTWSRCSFHLSFLSLFAGAPRPITSGAPHPRRYASALFSFPAVPLSTSSSFLSPLRPPRCPLIFRLLFLPLSILLLALASSIFPPFFLFSAISYSAPWE